MAGFPEHAAVTIHYYKKMGALVAFVERSRKKNANRSRGYNLFFILQRMHEYSSMFFLEKWFHSF